MFWLKEIRIKKKYTQEQMSKEIGVAQNSYCNIENGKRRPSVEVAKK